MASRGDDVPSSVWLLSNYSELDGRGGLIASGRWHVIGTPVLYCSDEPYTAYCEVLRHFGGNSLLIPDGYRLLEIKVPRNIDLEVLGCDSLDPSWSAAGVTGWQICQPIGDRWLSSGRAAMLKVPSGARPNSFNFLVNPVHIHADGLAISRVIDQPFPAWVSTQPP
jgi:RES domain-containing protein